MDHAGTLIEFKKEFSSREGIQFNNAGRSPISTSAAERLSTMAFLSQTQASLLDLEWIASLGEVRKTVADFLGAGIDEVAFTPNCATALSQAALGFPLRAGDEVITIDQEYASNYYPWKVACERSGAKFTVIHSGDPMGPAGSDFFSGEALTKKVLLAIRPGVKIVALSWVQFQTGAVLDLRAIGEKAHSVGAFFVVDGIQGIGQLPFSFQDLPVDFIAGGSHKWMCGPLMQGFFAVKRELLAVLQPTIVGCGTFNRFGTFADPTAEMELSARKFEAGGFSLMILSSFNETVRVHAQVGMAVVADEIARLSGILRRGLLELPVELVTPLGQASGITSFRLPLDVEVKFLERCKEEQIAVAKRGDFVRVSLHAYCSDDDVTRFLSVMASAF